MSGDPYMNIGPMRCGGCGQSHHPGQPCLGTLVGHSEFTPYVPGTPREPLPDFSAFQKPVIEQKLDKIIELLERLASREG